MKQNTTKIIIKHKKFGSRAKVRVPSKRQHGRTGLGADWTRSFELGPKFLSHSRGSRQGQGIMAQKAWSQNLTSCAN